MIETKARLAPTRDEIIRQALYDLGSLRHLRFHEIKPLLVLHEALSYGHLMEDHSRELDGMIVKPVSCEDFFLDYRVWMSPPKHADDTDTEEAPTPHDLLDEADTHVREIAIYSILLHDILTCDVASLLDKNRLLRSFHGLGIYPDPRALGVQIEEYREAKWSLMPIPLMNVFWRQQRAYKHHDYSALIAHLLLHATYRLVRPNEPPLLFATTLHLFSDDPTWNRHEDAIEMEWNAFALRWLARAASLTELNVDRLGREHDLLRNKVQNMRPKRRHANALFKLLVSDPVINSDYVARQLGIPQTKSTYNLIYDFEKAGIIRKTSRDKVFRRYHIPAFSQRFDRGEVRCDVDELE